MLRDRGVCCGFTAAPVGLVHLPLPLGAVVGAVVRCVVRQQVFI